MAGRHENKQEVRVASIEKVLIQEEALIWEN
jgi:hypothetical protein